MSGPKNNVSKENYLDVANEDIIVDAEKKGSENEIIMTTFSPMSSDPTVTDAKNIRVHEPENDDFDDEMDGEFDYVFPDGKIGLKQGEKTVEVKDANELVDKISNLLEEIKQGTNQNLTNLQTVAIAELINPIPTNNGIIEIRDDFYETLMSVLNAKSTKDKNIKDVESIYLNMMQQLESLDIAYKTEMDGFYQYPVSNEAEDILLEYKNILKDSIDEIKKSIRKDIDEIKKEEDFPEMRLDQNLLQSLIIDYSLSDEESRKLNSSILKHIAPNISFSPGLRHLMILEYARPIEIHSLTNEINTILQQEFLGKNSKGEYFLKTEADIQNTNRRVKSVIEQVEDNLLEISVDSIVKKIALKLKSEDIILTEEDIKRINNVILTSLKKDNINSTYLLDNFPEITNLTTNIIKKNILPIPFKYLASLTRISVIKSLENELESKINNDIKKTVTRFTDKELGDAKALAEKELNNLEARHVRTQEINNLQTSKTTEKIFQPLGLITEEQKQKFVNNVISTIPEYKNLSDEEQRIVKKSIEHLTNVASPDLLIKNPSFIREISDEYNKTIDKYKTPPFWTRIIENISLKIFKISKKIDRLVSNCNKANITIYNQNPEELKKPLPIIIQEVQNPEILQELEALPIINPDHAVVEIPQVDQPVAMRKIPPPKPLRSNSLIDPKIKETLQNNVTMSPNDAKVGPPSTGTVAQLQTPHMPG